MVAVVFPKKGGDPALTRARPSNCGLRIRLQDAPLVVASGAIFVPSTAIKGVVRYDDPLPQY